MTAGVILAAFGKRQYMYMAAQLAGTLISENADLKITLLHDDSVKYLPEAYHKVFDKIIPLKEEHLYRFGKIDPGFVKINIPLYLQYDNNLYLDVDACCLKDVSPLLETKKDFATEVVGAGQKTDDIEYLFWTTNERAWDHFKIKEDGYYRSVQSSSMFFRKGKFVEKLHKEMVKYYDFPIDQLTNHWGGTMPDELIISGVCAKLGYDPSFNEGVVFFGFKHTGESIAEIKSRYYLLAIYGPKGLVRSEYLGWYNRRTIKQLGKVGLNFITNAEMLLRGKHAKPMNR